MNHARTGIMARNEINKDIAGDYENKIGEWIESGALIDERRETAKTPRSILFRSRRDKAPRKSEANGIELCIERPLNRKIAKRFLMNRKIAQRAYFKISSVGRQNVKSYVFSLRWLYFILLQIYSNYMGIINRFFSFRVTIRF